MEVEVKTGLEETVLEGADLTYLASNRDQWQAFVNTIMNLGVL
jgi:hypothetical protein